MPEDGSAVRDKSQRTTDVDRVSDPISRYDLDEAHYYIRTSREKFDLRKVFELLGKKGEWRQTWDAVILPRSRSADYHLHVHVGVEKDEVNIHAGYLQEELNPHNHETSDGGDKVGAEDFMEWLGQFFRHETCNAHMHLHYVYPLASRQSKFPLPLKTSIEGDPEINGISLRLPKEPENVSKVILQQGKSKWFVEAIADRRIRFKGFTL